MEELYCFFCFEYLFLFFFDFEVEVLDGGFSWFYKLGSEYNLFIFMFFYLLIEIFFGSFIIFSFGWFFKSVEEVYEEMMCKVELF